MVEIKRRSFITLLGGAAAAWPLAARPQQAVLAQQDGRTRRIAWLVGGAENDRDRQAMQGALREGLAKLGWIEGRNLRIDLRWGDDLDRLGAHATELVSLVPEVIITNGSAAIRSLQGATQTIPIVFAGGADPVAANLVQNVARPEGNTTGFSSAEPSIAGKQFQLLKEAAPRITKVAVIFNTDLVSQIALSYFASIEAAASASGVQAIQMPVRNAVDIVHAIDTFAAEPGRGPHDFAPASHQCHSRSDPPIDHATPAARDLPRSGGRRRGRSASLRGRPCRPVSARRFLRRPPTPRRQGN